MNIEIIYQGERIILPEDLLPGYEGAEIVGSHDELPEDNLFGMTSQEHLASVHAQKAIEAVLILSGYNLTCGLLYEEAQALELDLKELAERVQANRAAEREFETQRRLYKAKEAPSE
ncbi:hypothetical protein [Erythrobacter sp. R86502]|uniref:hypothetical protein n=1 Tax=Erythrobacter sp. R86502 TaxID=3093846 RepID=UPI0036D2213D